MAGIEDVTPAVEILGLEEAKAGLEDLGTVGAEAFAKIAQAASSGDFTGLASMVGGKLAGAFTEAAQAALEFVDAQAHAAEVMSSLADATGMTVPEIEGLKDAFASVGIGANGFERAIGRLAITIGQEWSNIQQEVRTSSDSQANAMIGVQEAALHTENAYRALQDASGKAADQQRKDIQSITDAKLNLERANQAAAAGPGSGPQDAELALRSAQIAQDKANGANTSSAEKQLKIDEAENNVLKARERLSQAAAEQSLKAEEQANAVQKAKQAVEDANKKAADDDAKATAEMKQKILDVQKAQVAQSEAAEKAHEVELKNLPKIAGQIDAVAHKTMEWKDVSNSAEISATTMQKALVLAAGNGGEPKAGAVLKEMSALFAGMGHDADSMNVKMELVQKTMGAGFRAGQASAAQLVAVLDRGPEALDKFTKANDAFAKTSLGFSPADVDNLKTFNEAWASLDAILDQVKAHIAGLMAPGLTEMFNAIKASIEDSNGGLHKFIDACIEIGEQIGHMGMEVTPVFVSILNGVVELIGAFSKLSGIHTDTIFLGIQLAAGALGVALGAVTKAVALLVQGLGFLTQNKSLQDFGATASKAADDIAKAGREATRDALDRAANSRDKDGNTITPGAANAGAAQQQQSAAVQQDADALKQHSAATEQTTSALNDLGSAITDFKAKLDSAAPDKSGQDAQSPGKAGGGHIRGPGGPTDDRAGLFRLSDGEYVMKSAAVSHYGVGLMDALNDMMVGGFADGGHVRVAGVSGAALGGPSSILNLSIDGHKFNGLRAPADTAKSLKQYAVGRQTSSTGRKPSWMQ